MTRAADTTERQRAHASPSSRDAIADWLDVLERMLALPQGARRAIRAELEDHLRSRVDDLTITGLSEPEAVRAAVSELGETAALARRFKDAGRNRTRRLWMHALAFTLVGGALTLGTLTLGQGALPGASGPVGAAGGEAPAPGTDDRMRRYDVQNLVFADAPLQTSNEGAILLDTIMQLIDPADWRAAGGTSTLMIAGNMLFVEADHSTHERLDWLLDSLGDDAERLREASAARGEQVLRREHDRARLRFSALERQHSDLQELADEARAYLRSASDRIAEAEAIFTPFEAPEAGAEQAERRHHARRDLQDATLDREHALARLNRINEELINVELRLVQARADAVLFEPGDGAGRSGGSSDARSGVRSDEAFERRSGLRADARSAGGPSVRSVSHEVTPHPKAVYVTGDLGYAGTCSLARMELPTLVQVLRNAGVDEQAAGIVRVIREPSGARVNPVIQAARIAQFFSGERSDVILRPGDRIQISER